ncbi:MAG: hypothetical protein P4N59_29720 [Negativicutes bacterium]|nr:hypothetical protein [Negativicutes bacterium]
MAYALNVGEGWSTGEAVSGQYTLAQSEGWRVAESWSQVFIHIIAESLQINEGWVDIWQPLLRIFEGLAVAEALANSTTIPKAESWHTDELATRAPQINPLEGWRTDEAWFQQYLLSQAEGWNMDELGARAVSRTLYESWLIADNPPVWVAVKAFLETLNTGETMTHVWQDFLTLVEGLTIAEAPQNAVTKPLRELWFTSDKLTNVATKGVAEGWQTAEAPTTQVDFERVFTEAWSLVDSLSKAQVKAILEALDLDEAYLRSANAVISDLAVASGDLTADQFLSSISSPAGYGPFTEFIPGELEYQKALIALVLAGPLTTGRPQVTEWRLMVDVPDKTDSGTLALPAANTFIPFKVRFFAAPEVIVQLRGGSSGTPDITAITDAGFYVQINDATGHSIAGDIVWSAVGY